ncbi:MAG TPA: Flp pilus assembly protein CpaB [Pirellulales bacterium]|jgi:pilus assembly protein CpaB|nr:Flp pilus assembly protein CpaB [Pirellulales bacterium]
MRPKTIMVMVALACGLVAAIGIHQTMQRPTGEGGGVETTPIFVAKEQIGMGDPLKPEVLKLEAWPTDKVPPGAITKLEDTENRRTRSIIFPGEPIIEPKLLGKGESSASPTDMIPKGFRVVSIRVDAVSGAASLIKPGDRVDVLVHLQENPSRGITKTTTQTFLQHIKVFAVDDVFRRDVDGAATVAAKTVSLLVTPAQGELVMLATELGTVRLAMRSANDEEDAETTPKSFADLGAGTSGQPGKDENHSSNPLTALAGPPKQSDPAGTTSPVSSGSVPDAAAAPTPVAEQSAKDVFKMLILEGDVRREVDFEDGVPVSDTAAPDTSAGNQPGSNPPPVVDEPKEPIGGSSTDKTGP